MTDPVSSAVDTIQDNLDQGLFDWDVTHGELIDNSEAIAELTPEQRNEVISQLSNDDLENWAQEINGWNGSLSASERQDLFNQLAEGLDSEQAARVVNAFEGDAGSVRDFGNAIASHASSEAKVAFIEAVSDGINADYDGSDGTYGSAEALAVGVVLGSLSGDTDALQQALGGLTDTQLSAVLETGLGRRYIATAYTGNTSFDTSVTTAILEAVANSSDPALKARVFELGTQQIETIREQTIGPMGEDAAAQQLSDALTGILNSDTTGVVRELETHYRDGKGLTSYITEQLEQGRSEQVGELIAKLQRGNDLGEDPFARFQATDADGNYRNAQSLGYFMGGVEAAINQVIGNRTDQATLIANVFKGVVGALGTVNAGAGVAASGASTLTDIAVTEITDSYKNDASTLRDTLTDLAYPQDADGVPFEGEQAETPYDTALLRVVNANRFE